MPIVLGKPKTKLEWNEIDPSRDAQLWAAVDKVTSGNGLSLEDSTWLNRYEAAIVAFEEGRPKKLLNLEKSLGMIWDGISYQGCVEVKAVGASPAAVDAFVEEACNEIRLKRSKPWFIWF